MKYDLAILPGFSTINEVINLTPYITETHHEVLNLDQVSIVGTLENYLNYCVIKINVKTDAVLACALTLKPVIYPLDFNAEIIFGEHPEADYVLENKVLDLEPIIFAYILSEKPYSVYSENVDRTQFEKKREINPAFSGLEDLLKK